MAVSYVGVSSGNSGGGTATSFVTTLPAGWAAGDLAVLSGHVRGTSLTMSTPAGWTLLPGPTWPVAQGTNSRAYVWYRVLQSGDSPPTVTNSGSMTGGWSMTAYRGGNTSSPIGQVGTTAASGTSVALPTLVGVLAGSALAVAVHAGVSTGTIPTDITPDAAYTEVVDHATSRATTAANQRMAAAYRLVASAGSYGGETVTSDVTASMVAVLVEVISASGDAAVAPDGLSVPVTLGSPTADVSLTAAPDGISLAVALGDPAATWSVSAAPDGLTVPVVLGELTVSWAATVAPAGLSLPVVLGAPGVAMSTPVFPDGLPVPVVLGVPAVTWEATVTPDGLVVPVQVGSPSVSQPGQRVVRPNTGTVVQPSTGVVVRPDSGVVVRP